MGSLGRAALLALLLALCLAGEAQARKPPHTSTLYEVPEGSGFREVSEAPEVLLEGELRATVQGSTLRPSRGYTPLEVVLHNKGPAPRTVRLSFTGRASQGFQGATRTVEVGPRQRLSTFLLVPALATSGTVRVDSPGLPPGSTSVYLESAHRAAVLVLGTVATFDEALAVARADKEAPRFSARFLAGRDAPRELAAYVGYDALVVLEDVASLPAEVWASLEAYAATGGQLVLARPPRDVAERLPLLAGSAPAASRPYGFGRVRLCGDSPQECGRALLADVLEPKPALRPAGPVTRHQRRYEGLSESQPLLPNAQAPLGRFLALIFLFGLVVGPGGLLLARRRGPVALLIAVPSVALFTCLAIILDSVLVDGFGVHASRYSYTWLERGRSRAVTVALSAWYANLPPGRVLLPSSSALVQADSPERQTLELDWTDGLAVTSGFLSSRTYREWGEVAVVPSRARLVVRREGEAVRVQNALGAPLEGGLLLLGGRLLRLPALAEGAEGVAGEAEPEGLGASRLERLLQMPDTVRERFGFGREGLDEPLSEGDFAARLGGAGFAPLGSRVAVQLHEGVHLVRGQVDAP